MQLFLTKNLKIIIRVSDWLRKITGHSVRIAVNQPKRLRKNKQRAGTKIVKRIANIRLTDWRWNIMKEYELIWEIFNKCPRNQMRDVFVEELELEDPEEYIRNKFKGKEVSYEKTVLEDGTIIFDITTSQIKQRCSFTEI